MVRWEAFLLTVLTVVCMSVVLRNADSRAGQPTLERPPIERPQGEDLGTVRAPVAAGRFYPGDRVGLERELERLFKAAGRARPTAPKGGRLCALVMPHAGYAYSGFTAARGACQLKGRRYGKVIVLGPDHCVGFEGAALTMVRAWATPLGTIPLHADVARLRSQEGLFRDVPASQRCEHSIEVVLPFLQHTLGEFGLIPIVVGRCEAEALAGALSGLLDDDTLVVVSTDLSHYLPLDQARVHDRETIASILDGDTRALERGENRACGSVPLQVLMALASERQWRPELVSYTTSGDAAGPRERVVGYAAIAFYEECAMEKTINAAQGQALLRLARQTISQRLGGGEDQEGDLRLADEALAVHRGTFVTLTIKGELRGCIGSLEGREPIVDGVRHNAVNAAFHDPRFRPLGRQELDKVTIEVSILSEPQPLAYTDGEDLLGRLRPGTDGVIIRKGYASATFLPQVWEQLPDKEEFLTHLCLKAGLAPDAWRRGDLEVLTYQVQYFEEGH